MNPGIRLHQMRHLCHDSVQIDALPYGRAFLYRIPDPVNYITGSAGIGCNVNQDLPNFAKIDIASIDKTLGSASVTGYAGKWLIQLVRDRRRHLTEQVDPAEADHFFTSLLGLGFRTLTRRNIRHGRKDHQPTRSLNRTQSNPNREFRPVLAKPEKLALDAQLPWLRCRHVLRPTS